VFGKELPLATLFEAPTIEQLANHLRPDSRSVGYATLAKIQPKGSATPFFCVHGGAGSTIFLHRLARAMGTDRPLYGFEPEGLDGKRFRRLSVAAMATHYISEILKVQPQGPYCIGGYCFGGLVAFEMAQQLRALGEQTPLLALFSAPLRFNRPPRPVQRQAAAPRRSAREKLLRLLRSPARAVAWRLRAVGFALYATLHQSTCDALLALGLKVPQAMRTLYVARTLGAVERAYAPTLFPGRVTLFCGRGQSDDDPNLGWEGLAQQIDVCEIGLGGPNDRREIMNEPLVGLLAKQLSEQLDAAVHGSLTRRTDRTASLSTATAV
jgi:thioesterase domain-containing protein